MKELVSREIKDLVGAGERLATDAAASSSGLGHERIQELSSIAARGGSLITRLYGADSHYYRAFRSIVQIRHFSTMHSNCHDHVSQMVGILKGVQHDIGSGILADFRNVIQAEIFADFLGMAEHLVLEGYKDAAAVLLGAVLEDSLRKLAEANKLETVGAKGKLLTIEPLNTALAKKGTYNALVKKQVTSWANLRNDAAHARFSNYDADQVKQMLLFLQKFCADFLSSAYQSTHQDDGAV